MRKLLLVVMTCGLLALPVNADVGAGNWEAGLGLGFASFDSEVSDDDGIRFDARIGYHFTDQFQVELQLDGRAAETFGIDVFLGTLMANAVFNFHPKPEVVPYVLLGIGRANLEYDFGGFKIDDDGSAYQAAVGCRWFVGARKKMAVRAELNYLSEKTFDESSKHWAASAGLTWRLGG
jgi:opacity protein-like surface antigen